MGVWTGSAMVVLGGLFYYFGSGLGYMVAGGVGIHTGSYWTVNLGMGECFLSCNDRQHPLVIVE